MEHLAKVPEGKQFHRKTNFNISHYEGSERRGKNSSEQVGRSRSGPEELNRLKEIELI